MSPTSKLVVSRLLLRLELESLKRLSPSIGSSQSKDGKHVEDDISCCDTCEFGVGVVG